MLAIWLLAACTGKLDDSSPGGDGGDDGGGQSDADAPTIVTGEVYCCNSASGTPAYFWDLSVTVTDPQGADTMSEPGHDSLNEVNVLGANGGGAPIAEYGEGLSCDSKGVCHTSWAETLDQISCDNASDYTIEVIVADRDGNRSDPWEAPGNKDPSCGAG